MSEHDKNCYLGINGKKYGPLSQQDILTLYEQKKVNADTKFARIGDKQWIPLSQSGIISVASPVEADDLPPLPPENTPASNNANTPAKKTKLGAIAAGLAVAVILSIGALTGIILSLGDTPAVIVNGLATQLDRRNEPTNATVTSVTESASAVAPTLASTPSASKQTDETTDSAANKETYATFNEPHFDIEFDYPSRFVYERTDADDTNNLVIYRFYDPDYPDDTNDLVLMVTFDTGEFNRSVGLTYSLDLERSISSYKEDYESFELLESVETMNSIAFSYRGLEKDYEILSYRPIPCYNHIYINYGDYTVSTGVLRIAMHLVVPLAYENEYKEYFQVMIDTLSNSSLREAAEALIPSQYKESEWVYHPENNIKSDDGRTLFYGFSFYNDDIYGEILVNPVTGEVNIDAQETPKNDEFNEYDKTDELTDYSIVSANAASSEMAGNSIVGEWSMQENGFNYYVTFGADGSYYKSTRIIFGAGGAIDEGTYEIISADMIRLTLNKITPYVYEETYSLDGDVLYFGDNTTAYHRYIEPIDPNSLLDEVYEGTSFSPLYGNNIYIPTLLFNEARAYILDGDDYIDLPYQAGYAKSRYDVAITLLEQQGYKDTPLYQLALSKWVDAYFKEMQP